MNNNRWAAREILAFMIPMSVILCSVAWAISVYFMERKRQETKVELARIKAELEK